MVSDWEKSDDPFKIHKDSLLWGWPSEISRAYSKCVHFGEHPLVSAVSDNLKAWWRGGNLVGTSVGRKNISDSLWPSRVMEWLIIKYSFIIWYTDLLSSHSFEHVKPDNLFVPRRWITRMTRRCHHRQSLILTKSRFSGVISKLGKVGLAITHL